LDRIGSGAFAPGDRVVEARVCEDLGVSSIPVREAIRELVTMGVLAAATHKGAWVREVSLDETVEALQVKAALESLAARLAAPKLKGDRADLRRIYEDIRKAARRKDFSAYQQCNQAFHRHIVETAGNAALLRTWSSLAFDVRTRFIMDFVANGDAMSIALEHEPIVKAFEAGKAERAAELLAKHASDLIRYLQGLRAAPNPERKENA
jgi:DNA-binding GntR family transcriptional regulator